MGAGFTSSLDIANRALTLIGQRSIASFTEDSKAAALMAASYDKLRLSELERNCWVAAVRKAALRPLETAYNTTNTTPAGPTQSMLVTPPGYDPEKTYSVGALVTYQSVTYQAQQEVPLATAPGEPNTTYWEVFYGSLVATPWSDPTGGATSAPGGYYAGEIVYILDGTTPTAYLSLLSGNSDDPTTIADYDATIVYNKGATVTYSAVVYESQQDLNYANTPTGTGVWTAVPGDRYQSLSGPNWLTLTGATLASITLRYPVGAGPRSQATTRNAYMLPNGYLRQAPQDPKAGSFSFLGSPTGLGYDDMVKQGNLLITRGIGVLVFRFVGDLQDVAQMHPMFCEGLACRLALENCEALTQSTDKLQAIGAQYKQFMFDARTVNAIESGTTEPALDDYLACRV